VVIVGDLIPERLAQARSFGCETVDLRKDATLADQIAEIIGIPEVDCTVDCVGFEATVLNAAMEVTRAGGGIGIPGHSNQKLLHDLAMHIRQSKASTLMLEG